MPMNLRDYPANWREISRTIRFARAQGQCEAVCADGVRCGAVHGQWIHRLQRDQEETTTCDRIDVDCAGCNFGESKARRPCIWRPAVQVLLTTAHTCDCTPLCGTEDHLRALCQLHHLRLDAALHGRNARRTRAGKARAAAAEAGQLELA